jgi:uncharacterized membrane protein YccC
MRLLGTVLLLAVSAPLSAQEVDSASPKVQGYAPGLPTAAVPQSSRVSSALASTIVLPLRPEGQLRDAMRVAEEDLRRADTRLIRASQGKDHIRARAEQQRVELRQIETRRKQPKPDEKVLDAQKRAAERELRWTQKLDAMGDVELEAAREARRLAQAKQQALELELQLAQKREAQASSTSNGSNVVIRELEKQTLDAQKEYWKLAHQLASSEQDLAAKRLDLYLSSLER